MTPSPQRAFAVWFEALRRWSVNSFFTVPWNWPPSVIRPLSTVLERRTVAVTASDLARLQMVTLHFDGETEPRDLRGKTVLKGRLFLAEAGDVIYSKIDVRNGAIGVIPASMPRIAVTSEFPVYRVRQESVLSEYVKLLFRTQAFRRQINTMISGASGRKRVEPAALESVAVPIPPLPVQRMILNEWQNARQAIETADISAGSLAASWNDLLLKKLGITVEAPQPCRGAFVVQSDTFDRWDTFFYRPDFISLDRQLCLIRSGKLGDLLHFVSRPWTACDFPQGCFRYVEISNVSSESGITTCREVAVDKSPSRATTLIRKNDIIISTTRPYLGAFAQVSADYDGCVCSSGFAVADGVKSPDIDPGYVLLFLKSAAGLRQMERRMTGGLYPAIIQDELEKIVIPIPTKDVQHEILTMHDEICRRIAKERETARVRSRQIEADMEAYILGTKKVGTT